MNAVADRRCTDQETEHLRRDADLDRLKNSIDAKAHRIERALSGIDESARQIGAAAQRLAEA